MPMKIIRKEPLPGKGLTGTPLKRTAGFNVHKNNSERTVAGKSPTGMPLK